MTPATTLLDDGDWRLSLQRCLRDARGRDHNLGALPFVVMVSTKDDFRLLVPLIAGEALWLGFDAPQSARITGAASTGDTIQITQIGGFHDGRGLFTADSVATSKGARAIDGALVATTADAEEFSLSFDVVTPMRSRRIVVAFTTVDRFAQMTGVAPQERDLGDTYRGWLLP